MSQHLSSSEQTLTATDIRTAQAQRLWGLGVGSAAGCANFASYLESIPEIPAALQADDPELPLLVLVETRLGLKKLCDLGGIAFNGGGDDTFVAHDDRHLEFTVPTWIRVQDGRRNRNRSVRDCRKTFGQGELGLTAPQGVCTYLQHPQVVSEASQNGAHTMNLPGSVYRGDRADAACLGLWSGRPELIWDFDDYAYRHYGPASRRA
jgi:hypothetical protein